MTETGLPGPAGGGRGRITPIASARATANELRRRVAELATDLATAEERRQRAERTLADVARSTAGELADLRQRTAEAEAERDRLRSELAMRLMVEDGHGPPDGVLRWPRRWMRRLLALFVVAGVLLAADGVLTIAWQEPISAIVSNRAQAQLRDDLRVLDATVAATPARPTESADHRVRRVATSLLGTRRKGTALGRIEIPRIGLRAVMVRGTRTGDLRKGPGQYDGTVLPGMGGTIGIAGHRTTYGAPFRRIDELTPGSTIVLRMPYGRFSYVVTGSRIVSAKTASVLRSTAGREMVVLTACHPLYSAAKRLVVFARLQSGPGRVVAANVGTAA